MSDSPPLKCRYGGCNCCEELACLEQELAAARAQLAERAALLRECPDYMGHDDARCQHFQKCQCGLDGLLQRIAAALKEGG